MVKLIGFKHAHTGKVLAVFAYGLKHRRVYTNDEAIANTTSPILGFLGGLVRKFDSEQTINGIDAAFKRLIDTQDSYPAWKLECKEITDGDVDLIARKMMSGITVVLQ